MKQVTVSVKILQNVLNYLHEEEKDFYQEGEPYNHIFRDMRHLQNCIEDFANVEEL